MKKQMSVYESDLPLSFDLIGVKGKTRRYVMKPSTKAFGVSLSVPEEELKGRGK